MANQQIANNNEYRYSKHFQKQYKEWLRYLSYKHKRYEEFRTEAKPLLYENLEFKDKERIGLCEKLYQLKYLENYTLYHFTLTYKNSWSRDAITIERYYKNFHMRKLLPILFKHKNFKYQSAKLKQPIVYVFTDEYHKNELLFQCHHHAMFAVHSDNNYLIEKYIGTRKFNIFDSVTPYESCKLREAEPITTLYASKMYMKYPEIMMFPNTFKRNHQSYKSYDEAVTRYDHEYANKWLSKVVINNQQHSTYINK